MHIMCVNEAYNGNDLLDLRTKLVRRKTTYVFFFGTFFAYELYVADKGKGFLRTIEQKKLPSKIHSFASH